jgi:hypothetical protein
MIPKGAQKLTILKGRLSGPKAVFGSEPSIEIGFNPTEYGQEKSNTFADTAIPGLQAPIIQFAHGAAQTLTMELLIDTYTYDKGADIRPTYIRPLENLMEIDGALHAPPPCKIVWGSLEFVGVLAQMRKHYLLFKADGTPVRARVNLTFKEFVPVAFQLHEAPRSSPDKHKERRIQEGDSLWQLAFNEYGDPRCWRFIAETNHLDDPLNLVPGRKLMLAPLSKRMPR